MTPEQMEFLQTGKQIGVTPSQVDALLHDNEISLPPDHPDRRRLALSLLQAQVKAYDALERRDRGEPVETPPAPAKVIMTELSSPTGKTLSSMREIWIKIERPSQKQIDDNGLYVRYFTGTYGHLPVDKITPDQINDFIELLLERPRNLPRHLQKASLKAQVAWGKGRGVPRLARGTINAKGLGSLSTLMHLAMKRKLVTSNPCAGAALSTKSGDAIDREPYALGELQAIFLCKVYRNPARLTKAAAGVAAYWLPLLALFTGGRLEELGQLLVEDIKIKEGIMVIEIIDLPDTDDVTSDTQGAHTTKSVKSNAGRRIVPIHPTLVELGFLEFVHIRRSAGFERLFPELTYYRNRCTKNWSRFWGRLTDGCVTKDKKKTFHSFRHGFIRQLRGVQVSESVIKTLVGHVQNSTTSKYGRVENQMFDIRTLDAAMRKLKYPGLDLSKLQCEWLWKNLTN